MSAADYPQKITFAEMRESGVGGMLIYCADYRCSTSLATFDLSNASTYRPFADGLWICWRDYDETRVLSVGHAPSSVW